MISSSPAVQLRSASCVVRRPAARAGAEGAQYQVAVCVCVYALTGISRLQRAAFGMRGMRYAVLLLRIRVMRRQQKPQAQRSWPGTNS
jgi:hypothetical protein